MRTLTILFVWFAAFVVVIAIIGYLVILVLPVFDGLGDLLVVLQERREMLDIITEKTITKGG